MAVPISKVTRGYLNRRGLPEEGEKPVTFSLTLTEHQHAKLKFLAGRFDAPESDVARRLLDAAMDESLRILGAYDTMTYEETQKIPMEEQLNIVDGQVDRYHEEIRRIREEGTS